MLNDSLMITAISKGQQITIPAEIRDCLGLGIGSKVDIEKEDDRIIIIPVGESIEKIFSEAKNIKPKKLMSHEEVEQTGERDFR